MHSLLKRQLKRFFGAGFPLRDPEALKFLEAVDNAYHEFDMDRSMLERSLELSSQELLQSNSEMRAVFQAIPDLLFRVDPDGKIISCKAGAQQDLMFLPSELVGKKIQALPDSVIGGKFDQALLRAQRDNSVVSIEYSLEIKEIAGFYEARFVPLTDGHTIILIRNITERKQLEERFLQSQKMEAFGRLAGGVAHDFNNMLTVIQGNVSLMQAEPQSKIECIEACKEIGAAAERAANLTRQLLTFSRRRPMQTQNLNLNEVVISTTRMLQRLIGEHISLETAFAPGTATVKADANMLSQILVNLAVNSRDAMPRGGRLIVKTAYFHLEQSHLDHSPNARQGDYVQLIVSDTGCGIAPKDLPRIFEPFFTTKAVGKGTGLGLATVFGIVEQHKGWIDVESQINVGTTFRLHLPKSKDTLETVPDKTAPAIQRGHEGILLVEDDESVRRMVSRLLECGGYSVFEASSGVAAQKIWDSHASAIELVITDVVMPEGLNGFELVDRLIQKKPNLKIMICSGYADELLSLEDKKHTQYMILEKPFNLGILLSHVRDCLNGTNSR